MKISIPAQSRIHERVLLVVRHGEAAPKIDLLQDFERALTRRGAEACERVARSVQNTHPRVDLMISSPADRALETAHVFARQLLYPYSQIQIAHELYDSTSIRSVLSMLRAIQDTARIVAVFGHNPLLDELITCLVPAYADRIPKGGVACIDCPVSAWTDLARARGRFVAAWSPAGSAHRRNRSSARAR